MTPLERSHLVRKQLLQILSGCNGLLYPEPTFLTEAQLAIPDLRKAEFDAEVRWLEDNGFVVGIRAQLGGPTKWGITDLGRSAL